MYDLSGFDDLHVTVFGDLIADCWLIGHADRLCREAPVATVDLEQRRINAGPLFRQWHRAHISWRLDCPVCQTPAVLDDGTGMPRCPHNDSFVADVPVEGVIDDARDLMK